MRHQSSPILQTSRKIFLLLPWVLAGGSALPAAETTAAAPKPDVQVVVTATEVNPVDRIGQTTLSREEIQRQSTGSGDLNQLARTLNNVQFDAGAGALSEASILDLRPSQLSIAGGRTYENNFLIEGLSTTSVTDTTNTSIHTYASVVGHPQTTFLNPALVDNLTIYESDVPAEFGGFTGGVIKADVRDPSGRWGGGLGAQYTASHWVRYLSDSADRTDPMPAKPRFHRETVDLYLDVPVTSRVSLLLAASRQDALLENTQRNSAYGIGTKKASTTQDTFIAKLLYALNPETKLRFTSIWSPYEQENYEQDLKRQSNDGWLNKLELKRTTAVSELTAYTGFQWANNDRHQAPNLYTYKNFGAGDQVDWVADSASSGARGGNGDMYSRQQDIPVGAKFTYKVTTTGTLSAGADYTYTQARKQRPITNNAYRHQTSSSVVKDTTVVSAYGSSDLTVLEGEQALNYRLTYLAFDARVALQAADAWAQWSDTGKLRQHAWSYRAGVRYDTDDFLKNDNVAPRFTGQFDVFPWLTLHAGYNRYYTHEMLAYKLQEKYPDTYAYTRTYKSENGKKVYYDEWTLYLHSKSSGYSQAGLRTPHSDELSTGITFDLKRAGSLYLHYLERRSRDEFARDDGTKTSYVNAKTGITSTYTVYRLTNDGFTNYRGTSFEWRKHWRNHDFRLGATFAKTETSTAEATDTYFDENNTSDKLDEIVYYNGALVTRRSVALARANYARPDYYNFAWSSAWFRQRLHVDLLGRWSTAYDYIENSDTTIKVGTATYDLYQDTHVPANLINDLNVQWVAWQGRAGRVTLELKVGNLFNRLPHSEDTSTSDPYQQGRSFWLRTSYNF